MAADETAPLVPPSTTCPHDVAWSAFCQACEDEDNIVPDDDEFEDDLDDDVERCRHGFPFDEPCLPSYQSAMGGTLRDLRAHFAECAPKACWPAWLRER